MKQIKEERLQVRVPAWLLEDIEKTADASGWTVSDQVRYELMHLRGRGITPALPSKVKRSGLDLRLGGRLMLCSIAEYAGEWWGPLEVPK